jgi:hypothetical protein
MKKRATIFLVFFMAVQSCVEKKSVDIPKRLSLSKREFDLTVPTKIYELPKSLHEISGIATMNDSIVACIADNKGEVYFYNLNSKAIGDKLKFASKGDFEDIAVVKDTIYVLDSKGIIWIIRDYLHHALVTSVILNIEAPFELEGLCNREDTLFIAAKYFHNIIRDEAGTLPVWRLSPELTIDKQLFALPDFVEVNSSKMAIPFHTSAMVFDDAAQQWYFISTHGKLFIQCSYNGDIKNALSLSAQEFSQPEGICFSPAGDLLISNEGREGQGTILMFSHLKN